MSVQMKISEIARMLRAGEVSARELTQAFINDIDSTDEKIGAYLTRTDEIALKTADEVDAAIAAGGKLAAAGRNTRRDKGQHCDRRRAHELRLQNAGRLRAALRRACD